MVNLVDPAAWTKGTSGTVTTGATISISPTGSAVSFALQALPTVAGKVYVWTFTVDTTNQPLRAAGSSSGGDQVVGIATAVPGQHSIEFTAAGATTYIQFQRTTLGEARISNISVEEKIVGGTTARTLDGTSQYFQLNVQALGLPANNYNWYVGGWVRFNATTTGGTYIADFGRTDPTNGAGNGRVRLVGQAGTNVKLFASTVLADGNSYRENAVTVTIVQGTWYYIGMYVDAAAEIQVVWGATLPTTRTGTVPSLQTGTVCRVLQLGARVGSPAAGFAPCSYSDWIWLSGSVPTAPQITALASGTRPNAISGFTPTYLWPMAMSGTTENSLTGAQALTAIGSPPLVAGPGGTGQPAATDTPMDIIVI